MFWDIYLVIFITNLKFSRAYYSKALVSHLSLDKNVRETLLHKELENKLFFFSL